MDDLSHEHFLNPVRQTELGEDDHKLLESADVCQNQEKINYLESIEVVLHVFPDINGRGDPAIRCLVVLVIVLDCVDFVKLQFDLLAQLEEGIFNRRHALANEQVRLLDSRSAYRYEQLLVDIGLDRIRVVVESEHVIDKHEIQLLVGQVLVNLSRSLAHSRARGG